MVIKRNNTEFEGDITEDKDKILCICGSDKFIKQMFHMDCQSYAMSVYKCNSCGRPVNVKVIRELC